MTHSQPARPSSIAIRLLAFGALFGLLLATASPATSAEKPRKVEGEVKKPKAIHKVQPVYPEEARKDKVTGKVVVQAVIDEKGKVTETKILESVREDLGKAALEAIHQWKFEPATLEGKPVAVYFNLTINFKLNGDKAKDEDKAKDGDKTKKE